MIPISAVLTVPDTLKEITPTLDTAAHTAGDVLFIETELANVVRNIGDMATLMSVTVIDKGNQKQGMTIYFFDRTVTFGVRNAAPSISDADLAYCQGLVDIASGDYDDLGGGAVACKTAIGLPLKPNVTGLFVAAVTSGTPTHADGDLIIKFGFI
jgi:hypothetical protein